jgi:hypothetical protein
MMTDDHGVRRSEPESRQVLDTDATEEIARVFADIDATERLLFVIFALAVSIASAILAIAVWS